MLGAKKFEKVATMLDSPNEGERHTALAIGTAMLKAAGMRWAHVLAVPAPAPAPATDPWAGMFDAFSDGIRTAREARKAAPPPTQANRKPELAGTEIPATVAGRVTVLDERAIRNGEMLVVSVKGDDAQYGPMSVFDAGMIRVIREAPQVALTGTVIQPRDATRGYLPTLRPTRTR